MPTGIASRARSEGPVIASASDRAPAKIKVRKWNCGPSLLAALGVIVASATVISASGPAAYETMPTMTAPAGYTLAAMDKIRLKVLEWRPSRDEIYEWKALNEDYTVGATGKLSLPLIGEVPTVGLTTEELAYVVGQQLKARMGLASAPDIAIEIVAYRPFYIIGDVEQPGGYAGRPELTVLQAVSVAGGLFRSKNPNLRPGRELIAGGGQLELLDQEEITLLARKARLEAELKGENSINFPRNFGADRVTAAAMRLETTIFEARRQVLGNQMTALKELGAFLAKEVQSLQERIAQHSKNVALAHQELASVTHLMERRLTTEPRKLAAQRAIFLLEGDGLRLSSDLNRARKDVASNLAATLELSSRTTSEITKELLATQSRLTSVSLDKSTNGQLLIETASTSAQDPRTSTIKYSIVRPNGTTAPVEFEAAEHTLVLPGDTIKVQATSSAGSPLLSSMPNLLRRIGVHLPASNN